MKKPGAPKDVPREPCKCTTVCIEDTARSGRYCKLEQQRFEKNK